VRQQQQQKQRLLLLDVRRHDERTLYGAIPGALHIPGETTALSRAFQCCGWVAWWLAAGARAVRGMLRRCHAKSSCETDSLCHAVPCCAPPLINYLPPPVPRL
jgi:hypothetical protein